MIIAALLLQSATLPDFDARHQPDLIPPAIRGAWDASAAACAQEHSTGSVHIGPDWIGFYESGGALQILTPAGIPDVEQSYAMRFVMAGEGSTWDMEVVLGWDGQRPRQLTWIEPKTAENMDRARQRETWVRCSSG